MSASTHANDTSRTSSFCRGDLQVQVEMARCIPVNVLTKFSATLWAGIGSVLSLKGFTHSILLVLDAYLLTILKCYIYSPRGTSLSKLFLQRLNIYTGIPLTAEIIDLTEEDMGQLLFVLSLSIHPQTQR
ncbi:hypothetical protein BJV78DRAFT_252974 [Lactifluus subvellereus]|nr:hypothetical protein BJV78DRAFT_252974 [Lactifluus subvellereus]